MEALIHNTYNIYFRLLVYRAPVTSSTQFPHLTTWVSGRGLRSIQDMQQLITENDFSLLCDK